MLEMKTWYQSRTIWGALIALAASALQATGIHVSAQDQSQMADAALAIAGAFGGLLAIYGRIKAEKTLV
jgi:predicted SpoU family rRNA methylase